MGVVTTVIPVIRIILQRNLLDYFSVRLTLLY